MAKLRDTALTSKDLEEFLDAKSDFAFEMRVLRRFEQLGYNCEHGGTYRDPISDKTRQFDIRAWRTDAAAARLAIAAECKNISANFPLLVHAVPRKRGESFHDLVVVDHRTVPNHAVVNVVSGDSQYKPDGLVGKRLDQIGRNQQGDLIGGDQDVFEKVSQSINSTFDLLQTVGLDKNSPRIYAIVPMLVVPDGRLWQVNYSSAGDQAGPPAPVESATVFLDTAWTVQTLHHDAITYRLSHYEITTLGALKESIRRLWQPTDDASGFFFVTARVRGIDFSW